MKLLNNLVNNIQKQFFNHLVHNRLVYNSCWEDPRIDRNLLDITRESKVAMITSAGCNSFDYLLDNPAAIHCVDVNPAQHALLEFKKALFAHGDYDLLWHFFGLGYHPKAARRYDRFIRPHLDEKAQAYWDSHINYFSRTSAHPSFYYRGTTGTVALVLQRQIRRKGLYSDILNLLDARSIAEQQYYFNEIDPKLWTSFHRWILSQDSTLSLLGVPKAQRKMISRQSQSQDGLIEFVQTSIRHVMNRVPIRDNYFWRVYLTGSYTKQCSPNYLKKKYFDYLKNAHPRIQSHCSKLSEFLKSSRKTFSHFVLLDHQDWMAEHKQQELTEEWQQILGSAKDGARILFRSAGTGRSFLPDFVLEKLTFMDSVTEDLHWQDRVGTYGSTHLGIVHHD